VCIGGEAGILWAHECVLLPLEAHQQQQQQQGFWVMWAPFTQQADMLA
jgi:hypothetical protein